MQEFQVFDWKAMYDRIYSKRVFLYWFIPAVLLTSWGLTFSVTTYYTCTVTMAPEDIRANEQNRAMTLNRPENFDLGVSRTANSISPENFDEIVRSTAFLCNILTTPVMTKDTSFCGTYYSYLATQYVYPWHKAAMRFLRGKKRLTLDDPLPELDPFYLRGAAGDVMNLAQKHISCSTDRRTDLITLNIEAQDKLVAALVAQAVTDELQRAISDYHRGKMEVTAVNLKAQVARTYEEYEQAVQAGDSKRAAMLWEAYNAFQRQAIILEAQILDYKTFAVLQNPSVPQQKTGPHHITLAVIITALVTMLTLIILCWKELFGISR